MTAQSPWLTPQNVDRIITITRRLLKAGVHPANLKMHTELIQRFWPNEPLDNLIFSSNGARLKDTTP